MSAYFHNLIDTAVPAAILWVLLAYFMHRDRSRYRNCIILFAALSASFPLIYSLFGKYSVIAADVTAAALAIAILALPIALIGNGVVMMRREGRKLADLLSFLLGLGILFGEMAVLFFVFIPYFYRGKVPKQLLSFSSLLLLGIAVTVAYIALCFTAFALYTLMLQIVPKRKDFDYVIILGAGLLHGDKISKLLSDRIDKAIAIYKKDPTPPIMIPSGGRGKDETVAEGLAMAAYLKEHGIPDEKIMIDDRSKNTYENLVFSRKIIEEQGQEKPYAALVTSNYHVYRALRYCRKIGLTCTGIGSHVAPYYWPSAMLREFVAVHAEKKHFILLVLGWLICILPVILVAVL